MFHTPLERSQSGRGDVSSLLDQLARCSTRPRYAFMLLTLIADVARPDGSAGPIVRRDGELALLRDWLCDALTPMGQRDPRRLALVERVRSELSNTGDLPAEAAAADERIDEEVRMRVRASGKTNLSRAVSELVQAGLLRRHYQGYRVDHHNRGAQRQAVYTLVGPARVLMHRGAPAPSPTPPRQGVLALG
ncbi:hypothetical protein [Flavisphingomonas formosensis]|uniref:hypothetical protein n=1 Tax=Flavisphingomonas formosensis TaxID=861534 RepID=UPI0012FCA9E2|nr:hypothetical protein [Sphingomonas formosensis]